MKKTLIFIVALIIVGIFSSCTKKEETATSADTSATATTSTTADVTDAAISEDTDALVEEFETTIIEYVNLVNSIANDPMAAATMFPQVEVFLQQIADIQMRMEALGEEAFTAEQLEHIEKVFELFSGME